MPRDSFPFKFAHVVRSVLANTGVWFIFQTTWSVADIGPENPRGQNFRWSNGNERPSQWVWNSIIFIAFLSKTTPQTNRRFFNEKNVWSLFPIYIAHPSCGIRYISYKQLHRYFHRRWRLNDTHARNRHTDGTLLPGTTTLFPEYESS